MTLGLQKLIVSYVRRVGVCAGSWRALCDSPPSHQVAVVQWQGRLGPHSGGEAATEHTSGAWLRIFAVLQPAECMHVEGLCSLAGTVALHVTQNPPFCLCLKHRSQHR